MRLPLGDKLSFLKVSGSKLELLNSLELVVLGGSRIQLGSLRSCNFPILTIHLPSLQIIISILFESAISRMTIKSF